MIHDHWCDVHAHMHSFHFYGPFGSPSRWQLLGLCFLWPWHLQRALSRCAVENFWIVKSLSWFFISGRTGRLVVGATDLGHLAKVTSTIFFHSIVILSSITISVFWGGNLRDTNLIFSPLISFIYLVVVVIRVCICVTCVWQCHCAHVEIRERLLRVASLHPQWVVVTELRSSDLLGEHFARWAISPAFSIFSCSLILASIDFFFFGL